VSSPQNKTDDDPRRRLPSVDRALAEPAMAALVSLYGRQRVTIHLRRRMDEARAGLLAGKVGDRLGEELVEDVARSLAAEAGQGLRRVLNATGIFLHTNLGRAPLPASVAAALPALLDAACDLEFDLATGRRGRRDSRVAPLLAELTGAAGALVVNNNAAALLLVLATLAAGREVVVSRGELVEIGGSFRIPDILRAAGVRLVEVGTTNRTRLGDYARAIGPETALLLKVHPSNYRISGFVATVEARELAVLGSARGIPVVVDEGSGLLRRSPVPQLADHRSMAELLADGSDLVCGSGDKLLGGPQAGLLLGREDLIARCRSHPLYRALRADRTVFAALEGVLLLHRAALPLPIDRMWPDAGAHRERLERWRTALGAEGVEIVAADGYLGGGAAPEAPIPGEALALPAGDRLQQELRSGAPAVVCYLRDGRLMLDLRTIAPDDDGVLLDAVRSAQRRAAFVAPA
jgi:L-seryl-tRNA(Ser) seleniumtransferase